MKCLAWSGIVALLLPLTGFGATQVHAQEEGPADGETVEGGLRLTNAAVEAWYVNWLHVNYLGEGEIDPTYIVSPSLSFRFRNFRATLSTRIGASTGVSVGVASVDPTTQMELVDAALSLDYVKDTPLWSTRLQVGTFRGTGNYSFIGDTIQFERNTESFDIESTSFMVELLWRRRAGLKFIHYKVPSLVRSENVPDPRDPLDTIVKIEMPDTRFRHVFFVWDPFRRDPQPLAPAAGEDGGFAVDLIGHFRMYLLGFGRAKNDVLGSVNTWSTNAILGNPKEVKVLSFLNGFDVDLGVNIRRRLGLNSALNLSVGVHWVSWQIRSTIQKVDGLDTQLFSTEVYVGPYVNLSVTF